MTGYEGETRRLVRPTRAQWEYKTCHSRQFEGFWGWLIEVDGVQYTLDDGLNELGRQGWDLVGFKQVSQKTDIQGNYSYLYVFKRLVL